MSGALPKALEQAFSFAVGELGMCSAAWLFTREVAAAEGEEAIVQLRDRLGRSFPVLDAVASQWLDGARAPDTNPARVLEACQGASRLVVVGVESAFLDSLLPALGQVEVGLVRLSAFDVDWDRILANYDGRLQLLDLETFQAWAGRRSVLLTFSYGVHGASTHVWPSWFRVCGEDVRTQFRSLVGWDVLRASMYVYPRWLVEAPAAGFTHLV